MNNYDFFEKLLNKGFYKKKLLLNKHFSERSFSKKTNEKRWKLNDNFGKYKISWNFGKKIDQMMNNRNEKSLIWPSVSKDTTIQSVQGFPGAPLYPEAVFSPNGEHILYIRRGKFWIFSPTLSPPTSNPKQLDYSLQGGI